MSQYSPLEHQNRSLLYDINPPPPKKDHHFNLKNILIKPHYLTFCEKYPYQKLHIFVSKVNYYASFQERMLSGISFAPT